MRRRCLQAGCPSCDWTEAADDARKEFWRGVEERRAQRALEQAKAAQRLAERTRRAVEAAERERRENDPNLN